MKCDKCGSEMVLRDGKYGAFWGCGNYPGCKNIKKVKNGNSGGYKKKVIEKIPYRPITPSQEQKDIIGTFEYSIYLLSKVFGKRMPLPKFSGSGLPNEPFSICVPSVPGSGKTTLLVELAVILSRVAPWLRACFACFNGNIRDTLIARIPGDMHTIKSLNQLGFAACNASYSKPKFNQYKTPDPPIPDINTIFIF